MNAHIGLALPEFVPYSILKNIHAVWKLWRLFGFKDRCNILRKNTTLDFCIRHNSIKYFKTWPTQCTVDGYWPCVFCEIAFGCANYVVLILWIIGTVETLNLVALRSSAIFDKTTYLLMKRGPDDIFKCFYLNQIFLLWLKFPWHFSVKLIQLFKIIPHSFGQWLGANRYWEFPESMLNQFSAVPICAPLGLMD